jgi:hypothetical protein
MDGANLFTKLEESLARALMTVVALVVAALLAGVPVAQTWERRSHPRHCPLTPAP